MRLKLVTAPALSPISVEDAKLHLRVDHEEDDAYIAGLVEMAREYVERYTGRQLIEADYQLQLSAWPTDEVSDYSITLPLPPLVEVTSVTYLDGDAVEQTLTTSAYRTFIPANGRAVLTFSKDSTLPTVRTKREDAVRINFTAGYGIGREDVPELLRVAMKLLVGEFYARREATTDGGAVEIPFGITRLLAPLTDYGVTHA